MVRNILGEIIVSWGAPVFMYILTGVHEYLHCMVLCSGPHLTHHKLLVASYNIANIAVGLASLHESYLLCQ